MKKNFTYLLTYFLAFGLSCQVWAQRQVTGTVTDAADGTPLPGVNISEKGTTKGTITDINGSYTLSVSEGATLVFSFIGYISQEVPSAGQSTINVQLAEDVASLSEIVVVGYGEQEKKDVTGAMATLKAEDFNAGVIQSPEQLFQGKLSGVLVVNNSGEPGGSVNINIRGANSIRAGNNPLFVVDGFPLDGRDISSAGIDVGSLGSSSARNPLNFINPADIQSIDILKDASATAIYGSRGANGVVIITTKKAKPGEANFTYNGYVGVSTVANELDLLDRDQYLDAVSTIAQATPQDFGANTDWQDEIFRTAIIHSHSMSFSKGTEGGAYRVSLGYFNQEGIVEKSSLERITARINATQDLIKNRLKADFQFTVGRVNDQFAPITNNPDFEGDLLVNTLSSNPTIPVRLPDGTFPQAGTSLNGFALSNSYINPVAFSEFYDDEAETTRILGNIGVTLNIIKGLDFRTNFGVDYSFSERRLDIDPRFVPPPPSYEGFAGISDLQLSSYLLENFLTYTVDIGTSKLKILGGYSYQEFTTRLNSIGLINTVVPGTNNSSLGTNNITFGQIDPANPQFSGNQTNKLQSFYGRVNYAFQDKYLVTATVRADGSSRFGENNRYAVFPSLAFAWRLSEEDFVPEFFTDLKLRAGWGITGNQEIPNGATQRLVSVDPISGDATIVSEANPDIQWEETTQWNIGLDFAFLQGRISGTIDYYDKRTTDLLLSLTVPQPAAVGEAFTNVDAELINTGIEFALNAVVLTGQNGGLRWDIQGNFTYFTQNTIEDLAPTFFNTGALSGQGLTGQFAQRIEEGQPLFSFFLPVFEGYDEDGQTILANDGERQFVGQAQPDFIYGITTRLEYKGFDLSMNFYGQAGNDVYNNTENALFTIPSLRTNRNVTEATLNSGQAPGGTPQPSTLYLEDAGFFRFNNFTLGYNFNTDNIEWVKQLRVYFSGQNVFVITDYSGYDPEVNIDKSISGVPSFGIDFTNYPRARTFNIGAQVTF